MYPDYMLEFGRDMTQGRKEREFELTSLWFN